MQKRNHIWFGAVFVFALLLVSGWLDLNLYTFSIGSVFLLSCITVFYSLLPDIDHKNSTITWWFFGIGLLGLVIGMINLKINIFHLNSWAIMIFSTLLLVFTFVSTNLFEHRGFTHSIPAGIIAVFPLYFVFFDLTYCFIAYVAWHSHLIGDGYLIKFK